MIVPLEVALTTNIGSGLERGLVLRPNFLEPDFLGAGAQWHHSPSGRHAHGKQRPRQLRKGAEVDDLHDSSWHEAPTRADTIRI